MEVFRCRFYCSTVVIYWQLCIFQGSVAMITESVRVGCSLPQLIRKYQTCLIFQRPSLDSRLPTCSAQLVTILSACWTHLSYSVSIWSGRTSCTVVVKHLNTTSCQVVHSNQLSIATLKINQSSWRESGKCSSPICLSEQLVST